MTFTRCVSISGTLCKPNLKSMELTCLVYNAGLLLVSSTPRPRSFLTAVTTRGTFLPLDFLMTMSTCTTNPSHLPCRLLRAPRGHGTFCSV